MSVRGDEEMTDNTTKGLIAYRISEDGSHGPLIIEDNLDALQKAVGGYIDVVIRRIGAEGREYTIVCDDEGALRGREVTAVLRNYPALVGDLLILRNGVRKDFDSLTDDDLDYISRSMKMLWSYTDHVIVRPVLEVV